MCKVKRHLYALSKRFVAKLKDKRSDTFDWLEKTCAKIEAYYDKDDKLISAVRLANGKYTYSELKRIKDGDLKQFELIFAESEKSA